MCCSLAPMDLQSVGKEYQQITNPLERVKEAENYFGYTATIGIFLPNPNALEETRNVGGA